MYSVTVLFFANQDTDPYSQFNDVEETIVRYFDDLDEALRYLSYWNVSFSSDKVSATFQKEGKDSNGSN